jgi:hypothetical protein
MQSRTQIAFLMAVGLILEGCATPIQAPVSHATLYSTDMVGKAAVCSTTPAMITAKDGTENTVAMKTGGGGWCGIPVNHDGRPFKAGLLTKAARSGQVYVHTVGDDTRIDYTPDRGPIVADSFAVRLIPENVTIQVSVNAAPAVSK